MSVVFADTSYYVALLSRSDESHPRAAQLSTEQFSGVLTTGFVLVELLNAFAATGLRTACVQFVETLLVDEFTTIIPASQGLFRKGFSLCCERGDKQWSLTDCISFTIMKARRISRALTADHHFEQAGFRALLRND